MISKTTFNMADKRGVAMTVETYSAEQLAAMGNKTTAESKLVLEVFDADSDAAAWYELTATGMIFMAATIGEEWPVLINDESHLRSLLDDIAAALCC